MDTYATAGDISRMYNITTELVRKWAQRDHWRRTRTLPRRYHLADAQASYDKRRHAEGTKVR